MFLTIFSHISTDVVLCDYKLYTTLYNDKVFSYCANYTTQTLIYLNRFQHIGYE